MRQCEQCASTLYESIAYQSHTSIWLRVNDGKWDPVSPQTSCACSCACICAACMRTIDCTHAHTQTNTTTSTCRRLGYGGSVPKGDIKTGPFGRHVLLGSLRSIAANTPHIFVCVCACATYAHHTHTHTCMHGEHERVRFGLIANRPSHRLHTSHPKPEGCVYAPQSRVVFVGMRALSVASRVVLVVDICDRSGNCD